MNTDDPHRNRTRGRARDDAGGPTALVPLHVKLPRALRWRFQARASAVHPDGMSGAVRELVAMWLAGEVKLPCEREPRGMA